MEVHVDVDNVTGLSAIDVTWNGNQRTRSSASTSSHSDLSTLNVELGNASRVGIVDSELLDTKKVITIWKRSWDGVRVSLEKVPGCVPRSIEARANI